MKESFPEREEMNPFLFDEWERGEKEEETTKRKAIVVNAILLALLGVPLFHAVFLDSNPYLDFTWGVHGIIHSFLGDSDSEYVQILGAITGISAGLLIPLTGLVLFHRNPAYFTGFCLFLAFLGSEMVFMADHMLGGEGDLIKTREWDVIFDRYDLCRYSVGIVNFTSVLGNSMIYIGFFSALIGFLSLFTTAKIRHLIRVLFYGALISLIYVIFTAQNLEGAVIGVFIILIAPCINIIKRDEEDS